MEKLNFERQYVNIVRNIIDNGVLCKNRTGTDTIALQHAYVCIEDVETDFPQIKGKKLHPKSALIEMLWFMSGRNDIQWLKDRGVNYWDSWANEHGTIGKSYGYQFRNTGGVDNLDCLLNNIMNSPTSRRLILNLWNVADLAEMELEPCVYDYHFSTVPNGKNSYYLDLHVTQRSCDMFIGVPYDFLLVGWLIKMVAELCTVGSEYKFTPRTIHYTMHDTHIYVDQFDAVVQYLNNVDINIENVIDSKVTATIQKQQPGDTLDDYLEICDLSKREDFNVTPLVHNFGMIKAPVAV